MKRKNIITISDNGQVSIPTTVSMQDFEIAELFDIMIPTVRGKIKTLLKSRFLPSCSGGVVMGNGIIPEYFGLEVVIAIAFQVNSYKADIFRKHILCKLTAPTAQPLFIQINNQNRDSIYN